ncbi:MAG: type II toxin-antitoxin system VapC family toxin [Armatimonadota bacterium]|jgi:predicted nucleic acid-binding protein
MAKPVVVNASVSVKWVNPKEPLAHEAMLLLADFQKRKLHIIVPLFWCYEIANALRKAVSRGELTMSQAEMALNALLNLPVEVRPTSDPMTAFKAALNFGCSIYDAFYLVLAADIGCELWTADRRLYNVCSNRLTWVKWIGDYQSQP